MNCSVGWLLKVTLLLVVSVGIVSCGGADDRKEVYIEKAKSYIKENRLEKARIEIKNALQIDPKYAEGYYLFGEIKYFQKDIGGAINNYKKAIELDVKYNKAKIALAKSYSVTDYETYLADAEKLLLEVENDSAFNEKASVVRATILIKRHQNDKAEAILKNIIKDNAQYINAYNTLGYLYLAQGKPEKVIELFKQGLKSNPKDISLLMGLADTYSKLKLNKDAEHAIKEVIALQPDVYSYKAALVSLYVSNSELDKAEAVLRKAYAEKPDEAGRTSTLISFLAQHRTMQVAINELESIVKNKSDDMGMKYTLSKYYSSTGFYEKAVASLNEIIDTDALSPLAVKAKVQKASIFYRQKKFVETEEILKEVLVDNRTQLDALVLQGKIDILNNRLDDAVNVLRLVVKEKPDHVEAPMLLAETLKKQGNIELAIASLQQSIDMAPGNAQGYIDYSNFLVSNKEINKALKVIDIAVNVFKTNFEVLKQKFKILAALRNENEIKDFITYMKSVLPERYEVYQLSGIFNIKTEHYDLAISDLKLALGKTKSPYPVYQNLIQAYSLSKKKNEMYAFFNSEARTFVDRKVAALQALGDAYFFDQEYKKATESYNQALSIDKKWVSAYEGLIKISITNKDYDGVIKYFKKAIIASNNKYAIKLELLKFYLAVSKYTDADLLYNELINENPRNFFVKNNYVVFILDHMKNDASLNKAGRLVAELERSKSASIQETVAWYYVNVKQYDKAVSIYEKIIIELNESADVQYHYGYALFESGNKKKAKAYLEAALKSKDVFVGKDKIKNILNQI